MTQLLEQLTRGITTTEVWQGLFLFLLLGVGLYLLGRGLGFILHFDGLIPKIEGISNKALEPRFRRVVLSLIGIGLLVPGLISLHRLTSVTTLKVLTSLTEEEYTQFRILEKKFNEEPGGEKLRIRSENVDWPDLIRRLKQERIDVIIFDITRRLELLREDLLKPLDDRRLFIPSSIYPTLLDNVNLNEHLYFLPYRPNVRIGWWNSHHPTVRDCASEFKQTGPTTWQDVKKFAECGQVAPDSDDCSETRLERYRMVLSAKGAKWTADSDDGDEIDLRSPPLDTALLLLEVLMASGKKPWQVCESWRDEKNEYGPLSVLRDIYRAASPRSCNTDWQTATGHLLSRHVALARNWSFSIATMRESGELQHFHPHVAWEWKKENNNRLRTLLGGDVIALPRYGRHGDEVDEFLRFLISKEAQQILVEDLTWPPTRFDVKDKDKVDPCPDAENPIEEDAICHKDSPPTGEIATKCECLHLDLAHVAVREVMQHAEPTPRFWSPEMHESFASAFHVLVTTEKEAVNEKLKEAAGVYCLAPGGETYRRQEESG